MESNRHCNHINSQIENEILSWEDLSRTSTITRIGNQNRDTFFLCGERCFLLRRIFGQRLAHTKENEYLCSQINLEILHPYKWVLGRQFYRKNMDILSIISESLKDELATFNALFAKAFESEDKLLQTVCAHVHQRVGKQMRPVVVLLSARLCGGATNNTYEAAAAYEILHTGSLVHDDVVDNTMQRRGQESVNAIFNNQAAVLVGDYLLTKAMRFISNTRDLRLLDLLVRLGEEIARGELLQLQHAYSIPTEEEYYEIIRHKTASLFAVCAKSGALTATDDVESHERLEKFGELLGLCFQIKDDIFDYTPSAKIGKPVMNDIREGKVTLPLLHALQQASEEERNETMCLINSHNITDEVVGKVQALVERYDGIGYAVEQMNRLTQCAKEALEGFEDEVTKEMFIKLMEYVKDRKL